MTKIVRLAVLFAAFSASIIVGYSKAYIEANGGWSYAYNNSINGISSSDQSGFGFNINAGFGGITQYTSFELGYSNLASPTYNGSSTTLNSFDLSVLLHIPLGQYFSIFGKLDSGFTSMGSSSHTDSETKFGYIAGAGVKYNFSESFYVQGLYQCYANNGNIPNANLLGAGIGFVF